MHLFHCVRRPARLVSWFVFVSFYLYFLRPALPCGTYIQLLQSLRLLNRNHGILPFVRNLYVKQLFVVAGVFSCLPAFWRDEWNEVFLPSLRTLHMGHKGVIRILQPRINIYQICPFPANEVLFCLQISNSIFGVSSYPC